MRTSGGQRTAALPSNMLPDARMDSGTTIAVSITINRPSPSTPRKYWMPSDGTQSCFSTNCRSPEAASEMLPEAQRSGQPHEAEDQRQPAREPPLSRVQAGNDDAAEQRNQNQDGQPGQVHDLRPQIRKSTSTTSATPMTRR